MLLTNQPIPPHPEEAWSAVSKDVPQTSEVVAILRDGSSTLLRMRPFTGSADLINKLGPDYVSGPFFLNGMRFSARQVGLADHLFHRQRVSKDLTVNLF